MSNIRLADEETKNFIYSLDELISRFKSGELKGLYLVLSGSKDIYLSGKPSNWELVGEFNTMSHDEIIKKVFNKAGLPVYLT